MTDFKPLGKPESRFSFPAKGTDWYCSDDVVSAREYAKAQIALLKNPTKGQVMRIINEAFGG